MTIALYTPHTDKNLQNYFAHCFREKRRPAPVFLVLDRENGVLHFWSLSRKEAMSWAHKGSSKFEPRWHVAKLI